MKTITKATILAAFTIICTMFLGFTSQTDLTKLWKEYRSAEKASLPKDQLELLGKIKKAALECDSPYDFYKAGAACVDVRTSINWKDRKQADSDFTEEVEDAGIPILSFFFKSHYQGSSGLTQYIKANRAALESASHPQFLLNDNFIPSLKYGKAVKAIDDYEYALWSQLGRNGIEDEGNSELVGMLKEKCGESYPKNAFIDYSSLPFRPSEEQLNAFVKKYEGKAAALMAEEEIIRIRFDEMNERETSSEEYRSFRKRCEEFEKRRKSFYGEEKLIADCCTMVKNQIECMDEKSIGFNIKDGVLKAELRNISEISVEILKDKKSILSHKLVNDTRSYYVTDTLLWTIPDINDDDYTVRCTYGKIKKEQDYMRHSLSLAMKNDSEGLAIFLADAKSGKPVENADVIISGRNGKTTNTLKGYDFSKGFVRLPDGLIKNIGKELYQYEISCRTTDGKGHKHNCETLSLVRSYQSKTGSRLCGIIMKDRAAFHPGETVSFKVIAYYSGSEFKTAAKGTKLKAVLRDPKGNETAAMNLESNEFGSASGSFKLEAERNGRFNIELSNDQDRHLCSTSLVVDEFVLPSFDMEFEPDSTLYLPGDEVPLRGRLTSYSGHSLASTQLVCSINCNGKTEVQDIVPKADGRFTVRYKTDPELTNQYIHFNIAATDVTGETLDWDHVISVSSYISLGMSPEGTSQGSCSSADHIFSSDSVCYSFSVSSGSCFDSKRDNLGISWKLIRDGKTLKGGKAKPGDKLRLDMSGLESGIYRLEAEATTIATNGEEIKSKTSSSFLLLRDSDKSIEDGIEDVFKLVKSDDIAIQYGAGNGPVWMIVEIYGTGNTPLLSKLVSFGKEGESFVDIMRYEYRKEWSDQILVKAFYFRNGKQHEFRHNYDRRDKVGRLPLEFTRFEDQTVPGKSYSFLIKSEAGTECLAAIFDKSSEAMAANVWNTIYNYDSSTPDLRYNVVCGRNESGWSHILYNTSVAGRGRARALSINRMEESIMVDEAVMESAPMTKSASAEDFVVEESADAGIKPREDFATTLAFEPFLRAGDDGIIELNFTNKDKLSTFVVALFAHNQSMRNSTLRREMIVSVPVKVSTVEPQLLYVGDSWQLRASLASNETRNLSGTFRVDADGVSHSERVSIPAEGEIVCCHNMKFNEEGIADIKISFIPDDKSLGGDAILIHIPVQKAAQTIVEAHSALLKDGMDRDALIKSLRKQFVNHKGSDAEVREISILELLKEAIPSEIAEVGSDTYSPDAISLSNSFYARMLCSELGITVDEKAKDNELARLMACSCADGGFAWFAGMQSSPVVTAAVIYRIASARSRGHKLNKDLSYALVKAAAYLDDQQFNNVSRPFWRGRLSMEQYMYVRSLVPEAVFHPNNADKKELAQFRKDAVKFLTPSDDRGLQGAILSMARRVIILDNLSGSEDGVALAKTWGVRSNTSSRLESSSEKDIRSLVQYAVEHPSGGMYYPNAVMPYRGLLESEAHAHALLCELLDGHGHGDIAEGLRLWIMVQKECQKWSDDAGYIEALAAVMQGTKKTLETSVVSLSCSAELPFSKIKASGNGMKISHVYYRFVDGKKVALKSGDVLVLGERILAEYLIHNDENRSFGRILAGRPACMRPVEQLSGYSWGNRGYYRIVRAAGSEFLMDVLPEEDLTYSEEFFVTQAGSFSSPAVCVESLYAPHYRANDSVSKPWVVRAR